MAQVADLVQVIPDKRQVQWQALEFYGFIHFGMNTMTDREWGNGHEDPALFNPAQVDTNQWAQALKSAGMTGAILTCKHHDGFCLWPSQYTTQTVAHSPWRQGHGDLVREFSDSCRHYGLKFGVYLSPWDRTEATYGQGQAYDDFYVNQLTELLTNYGDVFEVWLDGANGEGANGHKQQYDWDRYYQVVRQLQPNAVIAVCGPDARWIGNEAGQARNNEWSVVPVELQNVERIEAHSQHIDDGQFATKITSSDDDLGSRKKLKNYRGQLVWYPAELDTSIRPGWFYHRNEDDQVKSAAQLFDLYCNSVGGNATFLLNVPPMANGQLAEIDCKTLQQLGQKVAQLAVTDLVDQATVEYSSGFSELGSWIFNSEDDYPWVKLSWPQPVTLNAVTIQEDIRFSQRIEACQISCVAPEGPRVLGEVASVGAKRIIRIPEVTTTSVLITFPAFRARPIIKPVALTRLTE